MTKVLISGGSGLVGRHLCKRLQEKGYEAAILSRTKNIENEIPAYIWDPDKNEIDEEAVNTADYIVHLAGVNIGEKRWTTNRRLQIRDSRIKSGELILKTIEEQENKPRAFITASATGYYGAVTSNKVFDETAPPANDFLGQICREWEHVADRCKDLGIRSVKIRTGIALTKTGGALSKIIIPVRMGIGSAYGNGKQYMPWIHINDLCGIYLKAIEDTGINGAYNAVAPEHTTNKKFMQELARHLDKAYWFPNIPAAVLKLAFGTMSDLFLKGSRVSSGKITSAGYNFAFPDLESALNNLIDE